MTVVSEPLRNEVGMFVRTTVVVDQQPSLRRCASGCGPRHRHGSPRLTVPASLPWPPPATRRSMTTAAAPHTGTRTPTAKGNDVTRTVHRPTELLRSMLEERLRTDTNCLAQLTGCGAPRDSAGDDDDTVDALAASARRGVANATQALRRISLGTYGVCDACGKEIPLGRLRNLPHARFCVPCQRRAAQGWSAPLCTARSPATAGANSPDPGSWVVHERSRGAHAG
jgi:DnaK suppressor protein